MFVLCFVGVCVLVLACVAVREDLVNRLSN